MRRWGGAVGDTTKVWHTFACDERDKLGDTFLDGFLGFLCNLGIVRQSLLHDSGYVGNGQEAILLLVVIQFIARLVWFGHGS